MTSAHHFHFGHDPNLYKTEAAAQYKEKQPDINGVKAMDPYKNSYKIGDGTKGQPQHYMSIYNQDMTDKGVLPKGTNSRASGADQVASIQLGNPHMGFEGKSEFADKFVPKRIEANDYLKQKELKKELLTSKINFGVDPTPYDTTYASEHQPKPYCKDSGKSLEIMKDLRSTHYQFGYMTGPKDSMYAADFKAHGGKPSKLDPTLAKDLRSHHGNFGIDALDYGTSYQSSHSWKQPGKEGDGGHCPDCCVLENQGQVPCHPTGKNLSLYPSKMFATAGSNALADKHPSDNILTAVRAK